jgi:DNA topoisomerase-1
MGTLPASPTPDVGPELSYADQGQPGIERHVRAKGFAYRAPDGHWLSERKREDRSHLQRIRQLAIPPAYERVWICPSPDGHLQAVGYDARGRKQYRYHARWREAREQDKFSRLREFGMALPRLRQRVAIDLKASDHATTPQREHVLAALVRLLDTTHVRIGNESYTRENKSYGLTTLRNRHAKVRGSHVNLRFRGKSGVWHDVALEDPRVARVVRRCQNLPGQDLFQYEDEDKVLHGIGSADVNAYIREAAGGDFTAKDFRTWHASVHAWALLSPTSSARSADPTATVPGLPQALKEVAAKLGNTVAVCRKSYVHPMVLTCAGNAAWPPDDKRRTTRYNIKGLDDNERGLLCFLEAAQLASAQG